MNTLLLRLALAVIMIMHGIPGMFDNGVNDFGNMYLNQVGFAPFGLVLAWLIKISHVATAILLLMNKYIKIASIVTIFILLVGIYMIHFQEGWYVVGGGRNGMEFNFLLIFAFLTLIYPNGINIKKQLNKD